MASITLTASAFAQVSDGQVTTLVQFRGSVVQIAQSGTPAPGDWIEAPDGAIMAFPAGAPVFVRAPNAAVASALVRPYGATAGELLIMGNAQVGNVLSLSPLPLEGGSPITFQVQWLRNGASIPGATAADYTTTNADVGNVVTAQVTRPGGAALTSSNSITVTAGAVTGTYSIDSLSAVPTGATTASIFATVNSDAGTIDGVLFVAHSTATDLTPDQIEAAASYSQAVTSIGVRTILVTGLTGATSYDPLWATLKVGGVYYDVATCPGFATPATPQVTPGLSAPPAIPAVAGTMRIGWNPPEYHANNNFSVPFDINLLKRARGFSGGTGTSFDANGYPLRPILGNVDSRILNTTPALSGVAPYSGSFRLYGRGAGTISDGASVPGNPLFGGLRPVNDNPADATTSRDGITAIGGVYYWYVDLTYDPATFPGKSLNLRIKDTDPLAAGDHLRDMALVHSTHIADWVAGKIVIPQIADDLSRGSTVRWMQQLQVNGTSLAPTTEALANRRYIPETSYNYSKARENGVTMSVAYPIERLCKAQNEIAALARARGEKPPSLWYNWSADVTDARAATIAAYIRDNLATDIDVKFEYGNEGWNGARGFNTYQYFAAASRALWGAPNVGRWQGYRAKQLADIARAQITDGRVVDIVIGGDARSTTYGMNALAETEAAGRCATVYAVGGYFGRPDRDAGDFLDAYVSNFTDQARLYYRWWRWFDTPYVAVRQSNLAVNGGTPVSIPDGSNVWISEPLAQFGCFQSGTDTNSAFSQAMTHFSISGANLLFQGQTIGVFQTAPGKTVTELLATGRLMPSRFSTTVPGWQFMFKNTQDIRVLAHTTALAAGQNGLGEAYGSYLSRAFYEGGISDDGSVSSPPASAVAFNDRIHYGDDPDQVIPLVLREFLNWAKDHIDEFAHYKSMCRFPDGSEVYGAKKFADADMAAGATKTNARKKWDSLQASRTIDMSSSATLTLTDFSRDLVVFDTGAALGSVTALLPLAGTATPGAAVQYRIVTDAGVQVHGWADLATANGAGNWSGNAAADLNVAALRPEVRLKLATSVTATTANRFYAGHVIALLNQSEWARVMMAGFSHVAFTGLADDTALQVTYWDDAPTPPLAPAPAHLTVTQTLLNASARFRPLGAMSNTFATVRPGEKFHVIWSTLSGTGLAGLLDDADASRDWVTYDEAIHDLALQDGQHPGLQWMSWYSADGSTYQAQMVDLWYGAVLRKTRAGATITPGQTVGVFTYDHFLADMYDPTVAPVVISGPHRFENAGYASSLPAVRLAWDTVFADPAWTAVARRGMEITTYLNTTGDPAHPSAASADGYQRLLTYTALDMLQQMGFGTWPTPAFDNAYLDPGRAYVEVWSSAGPITTTRIAEGRGGTPPAGVVWGFKVNNVATTATTIVSGRVRITRTWADGDVLTFANDNVGDDGNPLGTWQDYPIVDVGQPAMPGIPVRPNTPQSVLGVIPAASIPPDSNLNPNLLNTAVTNFTASPNSTTNGWYTVPNPPWSLAVAGEVSGGASPAQTDMVGVSVGINTAMATNGAVGVPLELAFEVTTPDAAVGDLRVTVATAAGAQGNLLPATDVPITYGARNKVALPSNWPASGSSNLRITFRRTAGATGTMVIRNITLKKI